jgi:hypothetical protein
MASQKGSDMSTNPEDQERRVVALSLAVQLIGKHGGFHAPEDAAMSAAKTFDSYLKNGDES